MVQQQRPSPPKGTFQQRANPKFQLPSRMSSISAHKTTHRGILVFKIFFQGEKKNKKKSKTKQKFCFVLRHEERDGTKGNWMLLLPKQLNIYIQAGPLIRAAELWRERCVCLPGSSVSITISRDTVITDLGRFAARP